MVLKMIVRIKISSKIKPINKTLRVICSLTHRRHFINYFEKGLITLTYTYIHTNTEKKRNSIYLVQLNLFLIGLRILTQ